MHTHIAGDLFEACNRSAPGAVLPALQTDLTLLTGRRDPRIALLTPGPHHDDYFSHAYLARYLGYLLVEGGDLRTAGDRVFLKTLEGLKRIDLIVRCVDGRQSDPLELDSARYGGPPGLVQACRKAPALVRNALGSAVAQNRGLGAYLPAGLPAPLRRGPARSPTRRAGGSATPATASTSSPTSTAWSSARRRKAPADRAARNTVSSAPA